ncbi:MAG TPA: hypothetical protein VGA22_07485 [Gemmatimonadales bacterium]|jgi:hypothetical protein
MVRHIACLCAVAALVVPARASGQELSQALRQLNTLLAANTFRDHNGATGSSKVIVEGDKLVVEVRKLKDTNDITNVYEARLIDLNVAAMATDFRDSHASILIPSQGPVAASLRCVTGGSPNEWALPSVQSVTLLLRADRGAVAQARDLLTQVIRLGRAQVSAVP